MRPERRLNDRVFFVSREESPTDNGSVDADRGIAQVTSHRSRTALRRMAETREGAGGCPDRGTHLGKYGTEDGHGI